MACLASVSPSQPGGQYQRPAQHPVPPLLKLSVDLFRCIVLDNLKLHDQFILGQVCSAARTVTARPWKSIIANLPRDERMQFFHGISHTLPFHYVCASCGGLHEAESGDLPAAWLPRWKRDQEIYSPPFGQPPPCRERSDYGVETYWVQGQPYYIREKHIRMALKLHMLGKVDNAYFRGVMARSTDLGVSSRCEDVEIIYSIEPKIVANMFIFRSEWKLSHPEGDLSWASGELRTYWHGFCFHLQIYNYGADPWADITLEELSDQYPDLAEDIREDYIIQGQFRTLGLNADRALSPEMRNQEVTGHCVHCPTDYSIRVGPDNEIILRGWYDCGTHQAPDQPRYWDCVPTSHEPGSIRRMWEESE